MLSRALYLVQPTDQRHPDENQVSRPDDSEPGRPLAAVWRMASAIR
jgi:hypothetical protein